ncbi:MAG: pseudouridine synthase [Ideonella sp.]|nr:pseudouridine synthase [Ideonella sp.]
MLDSAVALSWANAAQALGLPLIWSDEHLCVLHKPPALLVHRSELDNREQDSVMDRLRALNTDWLAPVHRLDKATSGLLMLARSPEAARQMGALFETGGVRKAYLGLVRGWPAEQQLIDYPLARDPELPSTGQPHLEAQTELQRLARVEWPFAVDARHASSRYALVCARPHQGRRHQIRRHAKAISHPLVGDTTHGKAPHNHAVARHVGTPRLWLHAWGLRFTHPLTEQPLRLTAPPGPEWQHLCASGPWLDPLPALDAPLF